MSAFDAFNPVAAFLWFAAAAAFPMFMTDPVIIALSLVSAVALCTVLRSRGNARTHLLYLALFLLMTAVNPLFQHRGATVLFVLNDNPVTLESLLYGAVASAMVVSVLYWFRSFSRIMTGDKLLYLFSAFSPKLALLFSMTLRYIPLFGQQAKKVSAAQKALGLYNEDTLPDRIRGGARVFSVMVTWALENGVITADSMAARGYGIGRRTRFSLFAFKKSDAVLTALTLVLSGCVIFASARGAMDCAFYPVFAPAARTALSALGRAAYALLAFLPTCIEIGGSVKWRCLKSRI